MNVQVSLKFIHSCKTKRKNALVPVVTVPLGEPVTFTCAAMKKFTSRTWIHWYKQNSGDTLIIIAMQRNKVDHTYSPEFPSSRFKVTNDDKIGNLTILRTVEQDEGMYHCAIMDWTESTWMGTYLIVKGKCETSKLQCFEIFWVLNPECSLVPSTLQCSVLSESENNSCSEDFSIFWFKAGSNRSYPNIIYTDSKRADNCEKIPDAQTKCTYNFPKNISSSDPGTYYCAVATCGEILFGNVIKEQGGNIHTLRNMHNNNYSALHFSGGKIPRGTKKRELKTEEMVYSEVRPSG
uniref:Ig-like domain-containing protein n=1 Tax=Cyprinodon variegatus TaxID=28743 RepID=A0A3Q2EC66_CYPVA